MLRWEILEKLLGFSVFVLWIIIAKICRVYCFLLLVSFLHYFGKMLRMLISWYISNLHQILRWVMWWVHWRIFHSCFASLNLDWLSFQQGSWPALINGGSFSFAKTLFASQSFRVLLGFWGDISLPARVLLGCWGGLLVFAFFSLETLLWSDGTYSSGICTRSNLNFPSKLRRIVVALKVMSMKIYWSMTWITFL